MKSKVGITALKTHLSAYVRAAQKGKEIVIRDRATPIAKLTPIDGRKLPFRVIPASRPLRGIDDMAGFCPAGVTPEDVERIFAETRADRIDEWLSSARSISTRR